VLQGNIVSCKPTARSALVAGLHEPPCDLVVYYNTTKVPGLPRPVGVPSAAFPPPPSFPIATRKAAGEAALNRTEPQFNATLFPLLYFHGGAGCKLRFRLPIISGVNLGVVPEPNPTVVSLSFSQVAAALHTT
jgi:hypothetical protein